MKSSRYWLFPVVTVVYLLYASIFLQPWTVRNFSLIDDGQVLMQNASYLESCVSGKSCSNFLAQTLEWGTGRVRPTYWIIQGIIYETFRNNAVAHHVFRVFGVGFSAVILLTYILVKMKLRAVAIILAVTLFFTSFSFSENIIRLGPNEPFQILFLLAFSAIYLLIGPLSKLSKWKFISLLLFLFVGVFIKENNISILFALFFTELFLYKKIYLRQIVLVGFPA